MTCPYGNPTCNLPSAPMGLGLHRSCLSFQARVEQDRSLSQKIWLERMFNRKDQK
jgi:hypothetical protein